MQYLSEIPDRFRLTFFCQLYCFELKEFGYTSFFALTGFILSMGYGWQLGLWATGIILLSWFGAFVIFLVGMNRAFLFILPTGVTTMSFSLAGPEISLSAGGQSHRIAWIDIESITILRVATVLHLKREKRTHFPYVPIPTTSLAENFYVELAEILERRQFDLRGELPKV